VLSFNLIKLHSRKVEFVVLKMGVDDRDVERACKRIRLQSPEPDIICDNFEDFLLSDSESVPRLKCGNAFSASILEPTAQNKDETRLNSVGEVQVENTVRHVCLGTVSFKITTVSGR
jgi:hypothetical protein